MAYDQLQKFQGHEVKARLKNYFKLKDTEETCQLNATCDSYLGPFAIKTIAGTSGET